MRASPLLSVIIPVYGVEKYIAQCLESVINQTYSNLEIIVINDGTKDKSADIAKRYSKMDSRVNVYDYENGGLSVARNRGLSLANGDYIAFLDSDDWLGKYAYEIAMTELVNNDVDIVKFGVTEVDPIHNYEKEYAFHREVFMYPAEKYFDGFLYTVVWNAIYSRDLAMKVKYPEGIIYEDNYASGVYLALAKKLVTIEEVLCFYRVNYDGLSKGPKKKPLDRCIAVSQLVDDICSLGLDTEKYKWKLSVEIYHFLRESGFLYKTVAIDIELLKFILLHIDLRRFFLFLYILLKNRIKVVKSIHDKI